MAKIVIDEFIVCHKFVNIPDCYARNRYNCAIAHNVLREDFVIFIDYHFSDELIEKID